MENIWLTGFQPLPFDYIEYVKLQNERELNTLDPTEIFYAYQFHKIFHFTLMTQVKNSHTNTIFKII